MEKEKQITVKGDGDQSQEIDYFGGCPECGRNDGYLNVGREHWGMCDKHKTKWWIGSNLFSSWKEETEEEWKKNAERLSAYQEVEPVRDEVKEMVVEEKPRLVIKANNTMAKEYCPICGEVHKDAGIPWAIFVESSNACVCDLCVAKHAPQLSEMLFDWMEKHYRELEEKDKKQDKLRRQKALVKLIIDNGFTSEDLRGLSGRAFERNQDGEVEEVHYPITERSCESVRVSEEVPFW